MPDGFCQYERMAEMKTWMAHSGTSLVRRRARIVPGETVTSRATVSRQRRGFAHLPPKTSDGPASDGTIVLHRRRPAQASRNGCHGEGTEDNQPVRTAPRSKSRRTCGTGLGDVVAIRMVRNDRLLILITCNSPATNRAEQAGLEQVESPFDRGSRWSRHHLLLRRQYLIADEPVRREIGDGDLQDVLTRPHSLGDLHLERRLPSHPQILAV